MASGLRTIGESISQTGNSITSAWSGLTTCYSAPEAETLHAVLDPIAPDGEEVSGGLADAATALETFASEVEGIKERWSSLRSEAYDLRARIAAEGEDWRKADGRWDRIMGNESPLVAENQELIDKGGRIIDDYTEIENACANAINKEIPHRTGFEKYPEGEADLDPNVFYHGFEQDLTELATEWGVTGAGTDHGWWIDAGAATWDFGVGAVEGVGAMVGAHSSQGWFQQSWGDSLKEYHWDNLTSAASLVGLYDTETGEFGRASADSVKGAWKDLAHSVVPWEEWGERPGYVIGTALLNIGATVGGAVLTATGVGAVVGVPLMAWRGMAILDGMGGSNRGGGVDLPNLPEVPTYGGNRAPVVNIDTSNMTPSQVAQVTASLDRLNTATSDSTSGGSGRPGQPGSSPEPETNKPRKPADNSNQEPTTRQAQLGEDVFERVISPEDRADLTARGQAIEQEFGVSRRDSDTETPSRGSDSGFDNHPDAASVSDRLNRVSDEWRSDAQPESRGRELVGAAARGNDSHSEQSSSNHDRSGEQNLNLTNIDGDRSGHRSTSDIGSNNHSNTPQARDRGPIARNSEGNLTTPDRNSDSGSTNTNRSEGDGSISRHDNTDQGSFRRDFEPTLNRTGSDDLGPDRGDSAGPSDRGGERDTSDGKPSRTSPEESEFNRFTRDDDANQDSRKFKGKTRGEVSRDIAKAIGLTPDMPHKEFAKKFTDFLNERIRQGRPEFFQEFYNKNGSRFRIQRTILGFKIPQLGRVSDGSPWIALDTLPDADPPKYRLTGDREYFSVEGSRNSANMDDYAQSRKDAIEADLKAEKELANVREKHRDYSGKHPEVIESEKKHAPLHNDMTKKSESYGERGAEAAVRDLFDGEHSFTDKNGQPIDLPKVKDYYGDGNVRPFDIQGAPGSGNYQFDQIWPLEDGGILIVEAKSSQTTELGERTIPDGDGLRKVSQGSVEYLEATQEDMKDRGLKKPVGNPNELQIARMIEKARAQGKLYYAEVKNITPEQKQKALGEAPSTNEKHSGYSLGLYDIPNRRAGN